jgi:hypothetical protein
VRFILIRVANNLPFLSTPVGEPSIVRKVNYLSSSFKRYYRVPVSTTIPSASFNSSYFFATYSTGESDEQRGRLRKTLPLPTHKSAPGGYVVMNFLGKKILGLYALDSRYH